MKICSKCKVSKSPASFSLDRRAKDGRQVQCQACLRLKWASKEARERRKALRMADPIKHLLSSAKARSKKSGIPFSITRADLEQPAHCPVFGIQLTYGGTARSIRGKDHAASLDRISPSKGYVPGNVVIVSWRANRAKSNSTLEELGLLAKFYARYINLTASDTISAPCQDELPQP